MAFLRKRLFTTFERRSHIVTLLTDIFALSYHIAFLITFYFLHVKEMVCFNIVSILMFTTILLVKFNQRNLFISYLSSFIEVVLHQILAIYFVGFSSSFHFLIVIMGLIPFVLFNKHFFRSLFFSFLAIFIFILIFVFDSRFPGVYSISPFAISVIKIVNISLSFLVILFVIMIFTIVVLKNESILTSEIEKTKKELTYQSDKIIEFQNNTISRLANLVENRDSDTGLHVKRTSEYVRLLAQKAKNKGLYTDIIDDDYISRLFKAAPMHDIGKIIVSDVILKKPGRLTPEEFQEMQKHTIEGKRIIEEVLFDVEDKAYIEIASQIACSHHEKWDGSGYPMNLQGTQIPLSARIMALADVYDALVSARCYKEPMSTDSAFKIIEEGIGKHFDPLLGQLFVEIKDEITSLEF